MKKILLMSIALAINAFGCVCAADITNGFTNSKTHIKTTIDSATNEIRGRLIPSIDKNIQDIKKQNKELKKLLKAYMQEAEQKREILFLLEAINRI
ncbi:TPA: hypothetical protein RPV63_001542 [Campylobacter fetus subsp. venerealis]|nr:hypothetical protein [Campylobacter fetus subsp. venerealis]HDX6253981.1 hypothetical protein [Campylobacter fetus subsp. venerealis]HDX6258169.1 hypothetical protein [Campylobacter fetus subsp. venerealis]HDX6261828.1 hypothetical protein [Campylobacter fetus subsp. venerealis]HDX6263958.1 hypothetical protein [Campylobacter fetus subsp. venerealis]